MYVDLVKFTYRSVSIALYELFSLLLLQNFLYEVAGILIVQSTQPPEVSCSSISIPKLFLYSCTL